MNSPWAYWFCGLVVGVVVGANLADAVKTLRRRRETARHKRRDEAKRREFEKNLAEDAALLVAMIAAVSKAGPTPDCDCRACTEKRKAAEKGRDN